MTVAGKFAGVFGVVLMIAGLSSDGAVAQAYTYDPPTCGVPYREERAKPQELRVVSEMSAANQCIEQNKYPLACSHLRGALEAADRMGPESGSPDGIKVQLKTMLRIYACQ